MKALPLAIAATLATTPALAHVDPVAHGSFASGITHPLMGADHVLAMVGVGLLAVVLGGRSLVALPAAFVGAMAGGYALALGGLSVPMVEPMILASILVIGALVALAVRMPVPAAAGLVALFGLAHGAAHGGDLGQAGAVGFGLGFLLSTAALHLAGIGAGLALGRVLTATRVAGGLLALGGAALALG